MSAPDVIPVILIGRLRQDPRSTDSSNGKTVCEQTWRATLAVSRFRSAGA